MATVSQGYYGGTMEGSASSSSSSADSQINDRFKQLYPFVNEDETPLPRSWSFREKYSYIGLSQNNLRAHYKGQGKTHKDAASVRTSHPIPAACGLYYFEIKIVSKGRDGYMGIGLAAHGVSMNRLPGWDKHSYGYHGDDGHSFCSSGTGQPYGPTFTTGDVIGCGVNMVDNTCFYTKNGHNLGIAFTDLPPNLYPTVGLQTPGEIVEANFGQAPFVFDIEDMMKELRVRTRAVIEKYPIADKQGMWQTSLHRIVQTYLVHHGYRTTAEVFARCTGQSFEEDITSIKKRQRVQRLVLTGRIGEAIETTQKLYPGLLERNANLLFMLKCRQFIEMVNGTDSEVRPSRSPKSQGSSPSMSPNYPTQQQQQHPQHRTIHSSSNLVTFCGSPARGCSSPQIITPKPVPPPPLSSPLDSSSNNNVHSLPSIEDMNDVNSAMNGEVLNGNTESYKTDGMQQQDGDIDMENMESSAGFDMNDGGVVRTAGGGSLVTNGAHVSLTTGDGYQNGNCHSIDDDGYDNDMDVDPPSTRRQLCGGSQAAVERMLLFGRELHAMSVQLKREYGTNEVNKKMLQDAFSLLAYADPWSSPVGGQLDPVQREPVCAALNSAILESQNMARRPPLEMVISHSRELLKLMARAGLGSCAFADIDSLLK